MNASQWLHDCVKRELDIPEDVLNGTVSLACHTMGFFTGWSVPQADDKEAEVTVAEDGAVVNEDAVVVQPVDRTRQTWEAWKESRKKRGEWHAGYE